MISPLRLFKSAALACLSLGACAFATAASQPMHKIMLLTGQSNKYHDWSKSSPLVKSYLEQTGVFSVDVVTTPPHGSDMSGFKPHFKPYAAVVVVYEGDEWPADTKQAFVDYMKAGGGLVTIHDADNAFPYWKEWNEMIGVGGWGFKADGNIGARDETWGPMIRWRDGKMVLDSTTPGKAGSHPPAHEFVITVRNPDHAITRGLPGQWMHAKDEIYSMLRGPAHNVTVLATALPDKAKFQNASGENEPMLMTITYGQGRVFHTTLGHVGPKDTPPYPSLSSVDFITTLQRGTEWAATGKVTLPIPSDFPTAEKISIRE